MVTFLILIGLLFCTLLLVAYLINQLDDELPSSAKSNNSTYYVEDIT